jgi:predicted Zn-dependent peptidase
MVADPTITETRLANGIRVVTDAMPEARSVSIGVWAAIGGRDEPDRLAGASHFLEHLVFKGTASRSARDIAEAIDAVGGSMNAFTTSEHTAYHCRLPHQRLDVGLEILGDVLTAPAFRPGEVEAERNVILEEILMNLDLPEDWVHTLLADALFPDHPLGREVLGSAETVSAMTPDDIGGFFDEWYRPANLVVVAAGRLDHDAVVDGVAATLGAIEGGARPTRTAPAIASRPEVAEHKDTEQAHLAIGWRGVSHDDPERYAVYVANQILGGGMSSRLFQEIREERGLAYSVYSYTSSYCDSGTLVVYAGTSPEHADEVLAIVDDQVGKLVTDGPTEQEVEVASGYLEGAMLLGLEDSGGRMHRLGRNLMARDEIISIDEHVAAIRAVSADDVRRVADRVLGAPRTLASIAPG